MTAPSAPYARVRAAAHGTVHLSLPAAPAALCGASSRDGAWLDGGALPDCLRCATASRVAEALASWHGPAPRPGIIAVVVMGDGARAPVGECGVCGRVRMLRGRGLCRRCETAARRDGTITDHGWTRTNRLAQFAGYRGRGLSVAEASRRTEVSKRTGERYEAALNRAGQGEVEGRRMTDPDTESPVREAPRELLNFACATREDWTREETWNAMLAAKTAGLDWDKLALRLMAIAFRAETPPTRPRELWDFARGITAKATGRPPPAEHLAGAIAALISGDYATAYAATHDGPMPDQIVRVTGGQPVLDAGNDPRAGTAPATESTETNPRS